MKNAFSEDDIKKALHSAIGNPSDAWQDRTLQHLQQMTAQDEGFDHAAEPQKQPFSLSDLVQQSFLSLNFFPMKKLVTMSVAVVVIAALGWGYYSSPTQQFSRHISRANNALQMLEQYAQGRGLAQTSPSVLIASAYAQDENSDQEVVDLLAEVSEETDAAIEALEEFGDASATGDALDQVDELQDKAVEVFGEVLVRVETEEAVQAITRAIEHTSEQNEEVEDAQEDAEEAQEAGEEEVDVDVETDADTEEDEEDTEEENAQEAELLEEAQTLMSSFDEENIDVTPAGQRIYDALQEVLEACESGGDCQEGKAKGLATALTSMSQNTSREQARAAGTRPGDSDEDGEDDEEVDDAAEEARERAEAARENREDQDVPEEADENMPEDAGSAADAGAGNADLADGAGDADVPEKADENTPEDAGSAVDAGADNADTADGAGDADVPENPVSSGSDAADESDSGDDSEDTDTPEEADTGSVETPEEADAGADRGGRPE